MGGTEGEVVASKDATSSSLEASAPSLLPSSVFEIVTLFLDPHSLWACNCVSKFWRKVASGCRVWHALCTFRWKIRTPLCRARAYGCRRWIDVFESLSARIRMPRGRYTGNRVRVFAVGRVLGVDIWVSVNHRSDCILPKNPSMPRNRMIEFRITMQNTKHDTLWVSTRPEDVNIVVSKKDQTEQLAMGEYKEYGKAVLGLDSSGATLGPQIVAINGKGVERVTGDSVRLGPLGFVVIKSYLDASGLLFEPEFLERCSYLRLTAAAKKLCAPGWTRIVATAKFHDDQEIWKNYATLPGGCMYLNDVDVLRDNDRARRRIV